MTSAMMFRAGGAGAGRGAASLGYFYFEQPQGCHHPPTLRLRGAPHPAQGHSIKLRGQAANPYPRATRTKPHRLGSSEHRVPPSVLEVRQLQSRCPQGGVLSPEGLRRGPHEALGPLVMDPTSA